MFYFGWFIDTILSLAMPIIFAAMIDEIVYYKNLPSFLHISLVFVVMSIFSCMLYFLIYTFDLIIKSMYTFDIKLDIFKKLQIMSAKYMTDVKIGEVTRLINNDSFECSHFVIRNTFHFINGIISCVFYIAYMFFISPYAGLLALVSAPISAVISLKFGKKIRGYADERRTVYGNYLSWLVEILRGIKDVRILTAEKEIAKKLTKNHKKIFAVNIKTSVTNITADRIIKFVNLIIQLSIFTVAAFLAANGKITIGVFTVLIAFYFQLKDDIINLSQNNMDAQNRLVCIKRIRDFMEQPTENDWKGKNELKISDGAIKFESVNYAYDESLPIFSDFNLNIKPGEQLALVGKSGCGKTTVASLLIGFFEPQQGRILIDGQDIADCTLHSIRENIGVVQQDVLVFDGSIKENLLLANKHATDDELWSVCEKAGIADFFKLYPEGLDTIIGSNGIGLSGGQKQRLAIARIYIKNPAIIIFDEATSALDNETEQIIHNAWADLLKGRTAIVIAHRQSSVMLCERAALIENGHIVVSGNPHELCKNSVKFCKLFAVSNSEDAVAESGDIYV